MRSTPFWLVTFPYELESKPARLGKMAQWRTQSLALPSRTRFGTWKMSRPSGWGDRVVRWIPRYSHLESQQKENCEGLLHRRGKAKVQRSVARLLVTLRLRKAEGEMGSVDWNGKRKHCFSRTRRRERRSKRARARKSQPILNVFVHSVVGRPIIV